MEKFVCIHGHFYQPPRDNPWLEAVEVQDSAYPYHDWNARITAECYGPNTASRILDQQGRIVGIMNNFSRISFNVGPTLLEWMEKAEPEICDAIIQADYISRELHNGHGSAIAQIYNHLIMPLADEKDKRTQVIWGIEDFRRRFQRDPEGMWLAETAVDVETLEILAEQEILFTILAPRQAARVREHSDAEWEDVNEGQIDPRRPYLCNLPSGKSIVLFFYDGPISQDLAFAGLLHNGEVFAQRMLAAFPEEDGNNTAPLVHIATDGETYGHHHKKGEMALSYCLHHLESNGLAKITIYGDYIEKFPPTAEIQIHDNSSWSCIHGVERWRFDCGCCSGMKPGWNQQWREPLRIALDWLRDALRPFYDRKAAKVLNNPWKARDEYIKLISDRSEENVEEFLQKHGKFELAEKDKTRALRLLEMQRHAMLMYTSCGWFFDELSGIETTQIMRYAARAIQLCVECGGPNHQPEFERLLEASSSNLPEHENGADIYRKYIKPSSMGLSRVGAHYAVSSLFEDFDEQDRIYCYDVEKLESERLMAGKFRLACGRILVRSIITWEEKRLSYAVLHLGDQNVTGGVRQFHEDEKYSEMLNDLKEPFERGDIPDTLRALDRHFEDHNYSMWHLFSDQQRRILDALFEEADEKIETACRHLYQDNYYLMQALHSLNKPPHEVLQKAAEFVINRELRRELSSWPIDEEHYKALVDQVKKWSIPIDRQLLGLLGSEHINSLVELLSDNPMDSMLLDNLKALLLKYDELEIPLNLWRSQNVLYEIGLQQFFIRNKLADRGQPGAVEWVSRFKEVANLTGMKLE